MSFTPSDLYLPSKFTSYRRGQVDTILSLVNSSKRFNALSAPPGSGKSPIYLSASLLTGLRTLILVPNKPLQSQLMGDFEETGLVSIIGHKNYPCKRSGGVWKTGSHTESSDDDQMECNADEGECGYARDVVKCQSSNLVLTNYHHWISLEKTGDPTRLDKFDLIILDEAHEAHDILVDQLSITLDAKGIYFSLDCDVPSSDYFYDYVTWARPKLDSARKLYQTLRAKLADRRTLSSLYKLISSLASLASIQKTEEWIVEEMKESQASSKSSSSSSHMVKLSPVWGRDYAERYLFRGAERVILSSGTLSPLDCEYLGIKSSNLHFIDVDSTFPVSRRPVYYLPTVRVEYSMHEGHKRQLVSRMDQFISSRNATLVKGIVHSRSYDYANMILSYSRLDKKQYITHPRGGTQAAVDKFKRSSPPSTLVSPSIEEGFDFIGDLARYAIILKVPFIDKRSLIIQARCKDDKRYSILIPSRKITQMAMRIIRESSDFGEVVVFDEHFGHFMKYGFFAKWFKNAFRRVSQIPPVLRFKS